MTPTRLLAQILVSESQAISKKQRAQALWRKFGLAVRAARKERRIPLNDFAKGLGISAGMATYLENGSRMWSVARARRAVEILADWKPKPRPVYWPDTPGGLRPKGVRK